MILQALKNYYDRKSSQLPPEGWIENGIDFVVVLDLNGNFVALECRKIKEGKKIIQKKMFLPSIGNQSSKRNNSGTDANLLWDNAAFVFGLGKKGDKKIFSFTQIIEEKFKNIEEASIQALVKYLKAGQIDHSFFDPVLKHAEFGNEILTGKPKITFRIIEDDLKLIFEKPSIYRVISENLKTESLKQYGYDLCLMSTQKVDNDKEIEPGKVYIRKFNKYTLEYAVFCPDDNKVKRSFITEHQLPELSKLLAREKFDETGVKECQGFLNKILHITSKRGHTQQYGTCLITGKTNQEIELCHPVIKGVKNAQTSGAPIVSFNKDSFCSYGKIQSQNAPISKEAVQQYTKALNSLLNKDSKQKAFFSDSTIVFWSEKISNFENEFLVFLGDPYKDDPDYLTEKIQSLYQAIDAGILPTDDKKNLFFVLGLAPNAARISIRFWHTGTIAEFSHHIAQHFHDLELITNSKYQAKNISLNQLLKALSPLGKLENISSNMAGDWMRCILSGLPYPDSLYHAALRRIRVCKENKITYSCTAILKACLNRKFRFQFNNKQQELTMSLDLQNNNIAYRLGRLFAILEKIQEEANPHINATIKDRYYAAVSGRPATVMPILMRLKNYHTAKLEKGREIYFERSIAEILAGFAIFPTHLNLENQGIFAVGYYHQRQSFFTKSTK